jgi:hypothetical protein
LGLLLLAVLLAGAYTLKSRMGIDLFRSFSLKKTLHLKARHSALRRYAAYPKPGLLIFDTFARAWWRPEPASLWSWESGAVTYAYGRARKDEAPCLVVTNRGLAEWTYLYSTYYPVTAGEVFEYSGRFRTDPGVSAGLGVILYAPDGKTLDWNYADSGRTDAQVWTVRGRTFAVPEGTDAIRLYLGGRGLGQCRFSQVSFRKQAVANSGSGRR